MRPLTDTRVLRPTESALALKLVSEMDLLRLKAIARLHARGMPPDVGWEDLLQEALTRVLTGARRIPKGVAPVAFVAGVMRSLRSEHWRRFGAARRRKDAPGEYRAYRTRELALRDAAPGPERSLMAGEQLTAIERLFANDPVALAILDALGEGLAAGQIRARLALTGTEYDSARKRIRRCLLREGLTCAPD
ncbi:MAG: sigma-70 family RNA polymerase sigma factor [Gammaproteobacteria bacterium]|nr:sigma-70 family RNA polymerase sigma factor [Gammaproteobacteria bacterium]